jgi:hypothetical protein
MGYLVGLKHLPASWRRALICVAIALALAAVMCAHGIAAPKLEDREQCALAANMGAVAVVFAKNGYAPEAVLKFYPDLYSGLYGQRKDAHDLARAIVRSAFEFHRLHPQAEPMVFGVMLDRICNTREGDLDPLLGIDS